MGYDLLRDAPRRFHGILGATAIVFLALGIGLGFLLSGDSGPPTPGHPVFIHIGDSITQYGSELENLGWVARLQDTYVTKADVLNRGLAGDTTKGFINGALPRIRKELTTWLKPSFITVWLGANDAAVENGRSRDQHVPVDQYRKNLFFILNELTWLAPNARILLITPPVVDDDMRRDQQVKLGYARDPPDRNNEQAGIYAAASREVGESVRGVAVLDIYTYMMTTYPNATNRSSLLEDGLHLSTLGNRVVFEQINVKVKQLIPQFADTKESDSEATSAKTKLR